MTNCERRRRQLRSNYFNYVRRETQEDTNENKSKNPEQKAKQAYEKGISSVCYKEGFC